MMPRCSSIGSEFAVTPEEREEKVKDEFMSTRLRGDDSSA